MHAHAALACCRIALSCLACAAPLLPPPYLLFLSSTCFRVELMLCDVASPWLPPLLRASSLEFHRRSSFGAMSCLLPLRQPPPTATSTPVSATVDRMPRCLAVRFAGPCRIIERCPKPKPSPSSCHTGPELSVQPWLRPIMRCVATSLNRPCMRLPRRCPRVRAGARRCVRPHFEGVASNLGHQDHRTVMLLRCPSPASAPSCVLSYGPKRRTTGAVFFVVRAPLGRRPASGRVCPAPSSTSTRATPCSFLMTLPLHRHLAHASSTVPLHPSLAAMRSPIFGEPPPYFRLYWNPRRPSCPRPLSPPPSPPVVVECTGCHHPEEP
jgi:hypothetical protein